MIAAQKPARWSRRRAPQARITTAVSAAASALGRRAANGFSPKKMITGDLTPVSERRLVEAVAIIEIWHHIIAPLDHLARGLGETWFIAIDQRQRPGAREVKKQTPAEEREKLRVAGCKRAIQRWREPKDNRQILDAQNRAGLEVATDRPARGHRDRSVVLFRRTVRHWMAEHSNRTAKQVMRNVSRFGDWPEHVAAGLLVVAIAAWRGHKGWVHIGLTMIVACAFAGIAARGVKIAAGRARPSVKHSSAGMARAGTRKQCLPERTHRRDHRFLWRALFHQSARCPRAPADPALDSGLTHVCCRALPFGRRLRCDPWNSVRVVLRARIPAAVKRRRRQPP